MNSFNHDIISIFTVNLASFFEKSKTLKGKPIVIIAHTVKGKGVSYTENVVGYHGVCGGLIYLDIQQFYLKFLKKIN